MACVRQGDWLIDSRSPSDGDSLSQDISLHLPQRISMGPTLILADNPRVFLSVVRKRLARIAAAVEYRRCQTMDKRKRAGLGQELSLLRTTHFSAKPDRLYPDGVLVIAPESVGLELHSFRTIYITTQLLDSQLEFLLQRLAPNGVLVTYGPWPRHYSATIDQYTNLSP